REPKGAAPRWTSAQPLAGRGVLKVMSAVSGGPMWRRAGVLGWGGVAAAMASLASGRGSQRAFPPRRARAGDSANGVVPWVDHPAPPGTASAPGRFAADARSCRPRDLRVTPGRAGVGLGHTNAQILFKNRSASPCLLAGYPTIGGIGAGGVVTP